MPAADTTMLLELQMQVRRAVLGGDAADIVAAIHDGECGADAAARVGIYRNHAFATLTDALRTVFPVICRLVDERFFAYAAHEFIRTHPPRSRCLVEYGAEFPDFLAGFAPCRALPYLPDAARFEWALNEAGTVREMPPLRPEDLAQIPAEAAPMIRLRLQPSARYLETPWPVDAIWEANRRDGDVPALDLTAPDVSANTHLEIRRDGDAVAWRHLDRGAFAFRTALAGGAALAASIEAALAADPEFDPAAALPHLFAERLAAGFHLPASEEISP
jgi:hypothetical protein